MKPILAILLLSLAACQHVPPRAQPVRCQILTQPVKRDWSDTRFVGYPTLYHEGRVIPGPPR